MAIGLTIEKAILESGGDYLKLMKLWNSAHEDDMITEDTAKGLSRLFPGLKKQRYPSGSGGGDFGGGSGGRPTTVEGWLEKFISTQVREKPGAREEFIGVQDALRIFFTEQGKFRGLGGSAMEFGRKMILDQINTYLEQQASLLTKINEQAGMTGELSRSFREEIMAASPDAIKLGISFEELTDAVTETVTQSGKFKLLSKETIAEMALASKFSKDMGEFANMAKDFERVGYGVMDMSKMIEKMGLNSLTLGLNARETTAGIDKYLGKLNQYGFKNGVEGLNRMVQRSIEFRMNMENVFDVAEKVWDPDGALEIVANLQMIGGAYGDLNDPIRLMYMATNDVEGLQTAIIGAAKSLVTYNAEQGRFEITGANLRRAKEMAEQFGMSMEELTSTGIAGMERLQASTDLALAGLSMSDEEKEFITNLAQMKGGKMVIEVPKDMRDQMGLNMDETTLVLSKMTDRQREILIQEQERFKDMDMKDIARQQVTMIENIERDLSYLVAVARVNVGETIHTAIEEYLGINAQTVSEVTDKIATKAGKWAEGKADFAQEAMKGGVLPEWLKAPKNRATKTAEELQPLPVTTTSTSTPTKTPQAVEEYVTKRATIDVNFNSNSPLTDPMRRMLFNDPEHMRDWARSYLNVK